MSGAAPAVPPRPPNGPDGRDGPDGPDAPDGPGQHRAGRLVARLLLGALLLVAGTAHLGPARQEFRAQVPGWLPLAPDLVVVASGVVELVLGAALVLAPGRVRPVVGWVVAAFFVAVLPGNVSQLLTGTDAFGLDSSTSRAVRLLFQPLLVVQALWSTGAWRAWRSWRSRRS